MPQRPVRPDMNLSKPNKLLRPNIIKSKVLITIIILKLYSSDFGHFHVALMKSVGQLAFLLICVSLIPLTPVAGQLADTPFSRHLSKYSYSKTTVHNNYARINWVKYCALALKQVKFGSNY